MRSPIVCGCVGGCRGGYGGNGRFAYERGRLENFRRMFPTWRTRYDDVYLISCSLIMDCTVFLTVFTGTCTYVMGQIIVKLILEPVQELRKTIGQVSHMLIEHGSEIHTPGIADEAVIQGVSDKLAMMSAQLNAHLYLVPAYGLTAWVFRLPSRDDVLTASSALMGLANSVFPSKNTRIFESNIRKKELVCDKLKIYLPPEDRISRAEDLDE